jgi:ceramide glucosyltransferase
MRKIASDIAAMICIAFGVLLLPVWAYLIAAALAAARFARRGAAPSGIRPPISVLKPLRGAEPGLYDNLLSFAQQDYPVLQIVLGVRNPSDSALPAARRLVRDLPVADIAVVVDPRATGNNLKIANLENMLPSARHDILVLADSDIRVGRDYLDAVVAPLLQPRTGIVTCLYKGVPTGGLWSELGALHINFGFLPSALLAEVLGIGGGCFGATIAIRRRLFERIGGFATLRDELADDHRIGAAVRTLGLATVLSPYLVENRVSETSLAGLWRHELRWARTVRTLAPVGFAGSIVTHGVVLAMLAAVASGMGLVGLGFLVVSCLLRFLSAAAIARLLGLPTARLWLLPLRDALSFAVFLGSFCGRNVYWRGQFLRVEPSGRMTADGDRAA